MATSVADICNIALTEIGQSRIVNISDDSERAILCNLNYEKSRDAVLRLHDWSCARTEATLAQLSAAQDSDLWDYHYQLPSDYIRMIDMPDAPDAEWEIFGSTLRTNESSVTIRYVYRLLDTNQFDPMLVQCIALHLAFRICYKLTKSRLMRSDLLKEFKVELRRARGISSRENTEHGPTAEPALWTSA